MKKAIKTIALILVIILSISLVACNRAEPEIVAGKDGADGKDGVVPHIGKNGNWYIGDTDTGISAKGADGVNGKNGADGKDGADGEDGVDGVNGSDGKDAYEVAVEYGFSGTFEEWKQLIYPESDSLIEALLTSNDIDDLAEAVLKSSNFVNIADYVKPNSGEDVSTKINTVIATNPNKTIFFPDGEYIVTKPIKTSAKYNKSVSLYLSNYAVIKADDENWAGDEDEAIIMLGEAEHYNSIYYAGSNYFLEGGIIDGSGVANGVSIDSGRETRVENVAIKNTKVGLWVKTGANNKSSDCDMLNLSIVGNGTADSIGVRCTGYDNTFDGVRISGVKTGVYIDGGGNFFRDIQVDYTLTKDKYEGSIGINEKAGGNWYDLCAVEQFETGFSIHGGSNSIFNSCSARWTDGTYGAEIAFKADNYFRASIKSPKVTFAANSTRANNALLKGITNFTNASVDGYIQYPIFDSTLCGDTTYEKFIVQYTTAGGN